MKKIYSLFVACFFVSNAFAMADRTPPVYGVPTLYGEYEISSVDTRRASDMYGAGSHRVAPIRAGATQGAKDAHVAKHPVKAKKVAHKNTVKKKKAKNKQPTPKQVVTSAKIESSIPQKEPEIKIVSVDKVPVETKSVPVPSADALNIATHAANKTDIESFCTQIKPQGQGNLPDGIIMMPGRPDLMSCVSNAND